ncbi:hypothetical protein HK102_013366, partial [Quaeritorhiza haematococci]
MVNDLEIAELSEPLRLRFRELQSKVAELTTANVKLTTANAKLTTANAKLTVANTKLTTANAKLTRKVDTLEGRLQTVSVQVQSRSTTNQNTTVYDEYDEREHLIYDEHGDVVHGYHLNDAVPGWRGPTRDIRLFVEPGDAALYRVPAKATMKKLGQMFLIEDDGSIPNIETNLFCKGNLLGENERLDDVMN